MRYTNEQTTALLAAVSKHPKVFGSQHTTPKDWGEIALDAGGSSQFVGLLADVWNSAAAKRLWQRLLVVYKKHEKSGSGSTWPHFEPIRAMMLRRPPSQPKDTINNRGPKQFNILIQGAFLTAIKMRAQLTKPEEDGLIVNWKAIAVEANTIALAQNPNVLPLLTSFTASHLWTTLKRTFRRKQCEAADRQSTGSENNGATEWPLFDLMKALVGPNRGPRVLRDLIGAPPVLDELFVPAMYIKPRREHQPVAKRKSGSAAGASQEPAARNRDQFSAQTPSFLEMQLEMFLILERRGLSLKNVQDKHLKELEDLVIATDHCDWK